MTYITTAGRIPNNYYILPMISSITTAVLSATASSMPPSTFISDDPSSSRISYLSSTTTSLIACITPMIGLMYLCILSWTFQHARKNPRPLNKTSGVRLQKYAPSESEKYTFDSLIDFIYISVGYVFLVLTSLTAVCRSRGAFQNIVRIFDCFLACFFQLVDSSISVQSQLPQYSDEKRRSFPLVCPYFHFYSKISSFESYLCSVKT